ncbi:MAG: SusC/RagA family TonB-linked outer membrane protein [Bacteroidetes bacterium]|nr:MAG: SusC/RagA family TonB-linked outer membrane protein [Bacteroidota bacterium]
MKKFFVYLIALSIVLVGTLTAQDRQISGKISSDKGEALTGVTVMVKGTAIGTFTKSDGTYKLSVPKTARTLIFKRLGVKTKELSIGSNDVINVTMEEDKILMDEVVVTAIGLEREKKSLGYSVEEVGGKIISESRTTNILNSLTGKVAGVQVTNSSGTPGAASYIKIRGISSITGENQPLFVIDGVPIDNTMSYSGNPDDGNNNLLEGVNYSNRAIDINPDDIESVSVLKGPAATALYGIRAASGAIIITTKKGTMSEGEPINVSFSATSTFEEVNKMPEMQDKYAQGQLVDAAGKRMGQNGFNVNTAVPTYRGPGKHESLSWGPPLTGLSWDGQPNIYDKNGNIVLNSDPSAVKPVTPYDNIGNFFQMGSTYTESLNMAGGTEFGSYFFSLSNSTSKGIIPMSTFDRTTVRITGEAKISSRLKASGSMSYSNSGGTRIQTGSNTSGVMLGLVRTPCTFDNSNGFGKDGASNPEAYMYLDNNTQRTYRGVGFYGAPYGYYDNPFWTVNRNTFKDNVDRFIGYFQTNYYVAEWLDIMYRLGADIYSDKRKMDFSIGSSNVPAGQIQDHQLFNSDINSDLILTFTQKITDDLFAKFLLGNNMYQSKGTSIYVQGDGLKNFGFYYLSNASSEISRQSSSTLRRLAFYGDLTLDYKSMIYLNGTLRNEMSTTLPEANNSFWYGAGNLSFVFTEAFKDVMQGSALSFGKLRFNYAIVGKDAPLFSTTTPYIPPTYADGWTSGISFPILKTVGYATGDVLGNDKLKPEKTTSFEVGVDLSFFDNLFGLNLTYYSSKSVDQIFNVPISATSGYWRKVMNAGEISNNGFEAVLTATPVNSNNFKWDFAINFSTYKNMVDKLADGVENIFLGGFEGSSIRAVAGKPYGSIFGFGWLRDANGNVVINDDPNTSEYGYPILDPLEKDFGSANPDWLMGIRNTLTWEGLSFSFLLDFKQGGVLWDGTRGALYYFGTSKDTEIRTSDLDSNHVFTGVKGHYDSTGVLITNGQNNNIKVPYGQGWLGFGNGNGFYGSNTEDFIEDASWVRLREISVSYQLPKSIVESTPFSDIIITFTGRNLWLSTKYKGIDPETNLMGAFNAQGLDYFNMPGTRTYNISLNVKF